MPYNHNSVFRKKNGPCCDFDRLSLNDMVTLLIVYTLTVNFLANSFKVSWHSFSQIEGYYKYQHID